MTKPIDMILYCPNCGEQHIDREEIPEPHMMGKRWTNPPHRSHLCHECGCVWRPADVPTNGVASIQTEGKADTWPAYPGEVIAAQALTPCEYRTAAGHAFIFDGWPAGESPLELFDAGKWLECLHACMFATSRRVLLEDDQLLHELVHLALGIDICTHNTMAGLREAVKGLT